MDAKTFNLTWNNHLANLSGLFEALYRSGSLTDATLACQGGMLRAHKLVLAACSPYFERVFKEHYGDQPIIILRGVPVEELECLLDFMYRGSIDVAEEHLPSLIKTATDLEIRGLSTDHKTDGMYYPSHSMNTSNSSNKLPRCHIEAKVNTTPELQNDKTTRSGSGLSCSGGGSGSSSSGTSSSSCQRQPKTDNTRFHETEDDPMIIHHERNVETSNRTPEEQIRHIPPPMYKRETRYKGQKRVPIGRGSLKSNDILDIKIKDCVSLKDTPAEELFNDDMSSLTTVKEEPNFRGSSDPTVPAIQIDDDMYDHDQDSDNLELTTATSLEAQTNALLSIRKSEVVNKRLTSKVHKAQYKPFSCDLCTLAFTRASHLARHRRVHTGERPFACTLCPRMFARQDKLKQHLDSHLQWPKRRALGSNSTGLSLVGSEGNYPPTKGKRGRPRKIPVEHSAMEEVLKFGEFSSLLNKSQHNDQNSNSDAITCVKEENSLDKDIDCSYGCQVENGHDVQ